MENPNIQWSRIFEYRAKIHERYREVWDIPLIKKRSRLLRKSLKNGMHLLDVGGGLRTMKDEIDRIGISVEYKSMDVDRSNYHDYYDLDDVKESFDAVTLFEVIEHVTLEEAFLLLERVAKVLREGGLIIVSTPNIFQPARFMRDSTHKTFFGYDELCGLISMAGFDIRNVYRSYNDAFHRYFLKVTLFGWLFRFFSIDYAHSIFVVGQKRGAGAS